MVFPRPEEGMGIGLRKDDHLLRPDPYLNHKKILVPEPLFLPPFPFYAVLMSYLLYSEACTNPSSL